MTQAVTNGDIVLELGDSIPAGGVFNPMVASILAAMAARPRLAVASAVGGVGSATGGVASVNPQAGTVTVVNNAVPGTGIDNIDTHFATQVTPYVPPVGTTQSLDVFIHVGVNNLPNGAAQITLAQYAAAWASVLAKLNALVPKPNVWVNSILCNTEHWSAGPVWAGPNDAPNFPGNTIDDYNNSTIANVVAAGIGVFVPARAAFLALEPTGNPTNQPGGYLIGTSAPFVHPSPTGQGVVSGVDFSLLTVVP